MSDLAHLVRGTIRLYGRAVADAGRGWQRNWWWSLLPVPLIFLVGIISTVAGMLFGPFVGGFIAGIAGTLSLSAYFAVVAGAVEKDRVPWREIWPRTVEVFFPLIGVLFLLWIASIVTNLVLNRPEQQWLVALLNVVLVIAFNPIAEVTYQRRGDSMGNFRESLEFMKENVVEWTIPLVVPFLPLIINDWRSVLLAFSSMHPVEVLGTFYSWFVVSFIGQAPFGWWGASIAALFVLYLYMIFRGCLYRELSTSSRRKRIYNERTR